jgi:hypothetical protein
MSFLTNEIGETGKCHSKRTQYPIAYNGSISTLPIPFAECECLKK